MMQDITTRLCQFVAELRYENLDAATVEQVKLFIADYYAACYAGYRINTALNEPVMKRMTAMGGTPRATVLFSDRKMPETNAAFLNALYAHGADMDDGNRKAAGHIATHVMPAVFALAETLEGVTWQEVFTALVAGYDVFNRVVGAAQPGMYNKGFHSTGIGGGIACAAACAKLMGLDAEGIYNAVSLAAIQSSGLIIIDESGQGCKPINPANGARIGLESAQLAALGVESSRNPLESKKGWFNAFAITADETVLFEGLGKTFTINESYLKLYPSCRHTHCGIDAAVAIRRRMEADGVGLDAVETIEVTIYPSAIKSTGHTPYPTTVDQAKFSLHYCLAAALEKGEFGLAELEVSSCRLTNVLVPKIRVMPDDELENRAKGIRGAVVTVTAGGKTYTETVLTPKGEGEKRLSWEDLEVKFRQCAEGMKNRQQVAEMIARIRAIAPEAPYTNILS
ncbi:MAG: MmgE/PrpD family protein [Ruminococcaceae bacterium]|nr:MmgE/PrpD family protein [Oscillospiraceae bacterium]